jgi:antibiotic biosynthesis monooxygenase (ABM) superfamily enzyme
MTGGTISTQPVTAVVHRRIKPGSEASFESLMQEFMAFVLRQPGHLGINVIRPSSGSRDYTVLDRFATEENRRRFTASPEYHNWMERLRDVSEAEPEIQEMGGLAFWFTLPNRPVRRPPPRIKMAHLTLLGVYPLSMLFPKLIAPLTPSWPLWIRGLIIAALIVVSLTWFVMPSLTRVFEKWLFPSDQGG